jgi:dTDP-4-amino-4,6-dideoxy-D-galactose acyltransferase
VLVAENNGRPAGYITCRHKDGEGRIELIAVDAAAKGKGLGTALVLDAVAWFASQRAKTVRVATQARNIAALRLYEHCGFRVAETSLYFHKNYAGGR